MDDEPRLKVIIVLRKNNCPDVATNVPADVIVADENGEIYASFKADDIDAMAAKGMVSKS